MSAHTRRVTCLALAIGVLLAGSASPAEQPAAKLLPPDTFLYLAVKDVNGLKENFKKTSLYGLYKDPAMQEFVAPAEKKIVEWIDEQIKNAWKESGLEKPPESLPWPQGQVVLAMRMESVTRKMPKMEWSDTESKPKVVGAQEYKTPEPRIVLLADMGDNVGKAKDLIRQLLEKAAEKGYKRTQESVRGLEIEILTPPPPKQEAGWKEAFQIRQDQPIVWAFKDKTLLVGPDLKLLKEVAIRMGQSDQESLSDDKDFQNVMKKLSADQADVSFFLSAKALVRFVKAQGTEDPKSREQTEKIINALGLGNVSGLGAAVSVAPSEKENLRIKALIAVDGQRRGLIELLTPTARSTKPAAMLTKDLSEFIVLHYDPGKMYDQIIRMVQEATGEPVEEGIKAAMKEFTGGENTEPVDLRKDVLGQLAGPLTVMAQASKPYTSPDSQKVLLAIGVREGAALDKALGRLHSAFVGKMPAEMRKDLKEELLNCSVYVIPAAGIMGAMMRMPARATPGGDGGKLAFSVAGDQLVFGALETVRQCVRNTRKSKDSADSIAADPLYDYASKFLPAQAGIVVYGNQQIAGEILWTQVKEAAKSSAARPKDENETVRESKFAVGVSALEPMSVLVDQLRKYCDFTALPDFSRVRKYFGAGVGYVVGTEDGILIEMINVRSPEK